MAQKKSKIIVVDDHEIFRKGLIMTINRLKHAKVIAEAGNGEEFMELLEKHPDTEIVFMDIEMPGTNGVEITKRALKKYPDLKIVALSMFADDEYVQSMLDVGAKGFLIKNISREGLDKAIQLVAEGRNYFSDELWTFFTKKMTPEKKKKDKSVKFTKRELEVLELICEGLTNEDIAKKLFISERTVIGHKSNLIAKTECKNTVQLVSYAIKQKLVEI